MSEPTFDAAAAEYEAQLMQGLALSGESKDYFARGRVREVEQQWQRRNDSDPAVIVDFGCGTGDTSALLLDTFPSAQVVGLDPSQESLRLARRRSQDPRLSFATVEDLPVAPSMADLIYLNGVVHHVPIPERGAFFQTLASLLNPQGLLALFENNPLNPGTRMVMSRIPFDRDAQTLLPRETRAHVRNATLSPTDTVFLFYFPRWLRWLRPSERLLRRVPLGAQYGVFADSAA